MKPISSTTRDGAAGEQAVVLNAYSSRITQPKSEGASQAMLLATGLGGSDLDKPVGAGNSVMPVISTKTG